ncbi:MAG: hypothetical protein L0J14_06130 [Bifidobacterium crudilactis]|nr:hypothetical protein [Bifidobacterium crudilactis]
MSTRPSISMFSSSEAVAIEQHSTTPSVSRNAPGTARIEGRLTSPIARVPESTASAGGITVKGHTIRTFA